MPHTKQTRPLGAAGLGGLSFRSRIEAPYTPGPPESQAPTLVKDARAWCRHCETETLAELRRYESNNAVGLICLTCNRIVPCGGKLFVPHRELRALGIDPSTLPEARDE
jgi:hypothetical protein